ncbi:hypothetical protein PCE1_004363 [Barthelona sp. PCE]
MGVRSVGARGQKIQRTDSYEEINSDEYNSDEDFENSDATVEGVPEVNAETAAEQRLRLATEAIGFLEQANLDNDDFFADTHFHTVTDKVKYRMQKEQGTLSRDFVEKLPEDFEVFQLRGHKNSCTGVSIDNEKNEAYSVGKDGAITKYSLKYPPTKIKTLKTGLGFFTCCQYFEALESLVVGADDGAIYVFSSELSSEEEPVILPVTYTHKKSITGLAKCKDMPSYLFSSGMDGVMKTWDLQSCSFIGEHFGHIAGITNIACLRTEQPVTVGDDHMLMVWKIEKGTHLELKAKTQYTLDAVTMLSDTVYVAGGQDGGLYVFNRKRKRPTCVRLGAHKIRTEEPETEEEQALLDIEGSLLPDKPSACWVSSLSNVPGTTNAFFSGSNSGAIRLWHRKLKKNGKPGLKCIRRVPVRGFVNDMSVKNDSTVLVGAVGRSHRLGEWQRVRNGVKNGICVVYLAEKDYITGMQEADMKKEEETEADDF